MRGRHPRRLQLRERDTGLHRLQLPRIAHQHDASARTLHCRKNRVHIAGSHHSGLIEHYQRAGIEPAAIARQEGGNGFRIDTGRRDLLRGRRRGRQPHAAPAVHHRRVAHLGQHTRLASAGASLHPDHSVATGQYQARRTPLPAIERGVLGARQPGLAHDGGQRVAPTCLDVQQFALQRLRGSGRVPGARGQQAPIGHSRRQRGLNIVKRRHPGGTAQRPAHQGLMPHYALALGQVQNGEVHRRRDLGLALVLAEHHGGSRRVIDGERRALVLPQLTQRRAVQLALGLAAR
ncbi:hypothetical protein D3C72_423340 [compost metagenome]